MLRLYFGLDGGREHTLEEIGGMLGVTRERVRQLRDRALKRLQRGRRRPGAGELRGLTAYLLRAPAMASLSPAADGFVAHVGARSSRHPHLDSRSAARADAAARRGLGPDRARSSPSSPASSSPSSRSYIFTGAVPLYFVGALVGKTVMMELGPVLTGMALAGRVGASIAAELGTMKVTEQVDALETLAYDRDAYLVVPRVARGDGHVPGRDRVRHGGRRRRRVGDRRSTCSTSRRREFVKGLKQFYGFKDIWFGLVKSASFGAAVALDGLPARASTTRAAPRAWDAPTTRAVVSAARRSWCWMRSGRWCCCDGRTDR